MSGAVLLPGCRERAWEPGEDYERCGGLWLPPSVDEPDEPAPRPIGIGLFCGCGGMDLGFTMAGFHVAAASDGWTDAARTYLLNLGGPHTVLHCVGELPEGTKRERAWHAEHRGQALAAHELFEVGRSDYAPGEGWIANHAGEAPPCEHFYLGDICALTGQKILDDLELTGDDIGSVHGGPPCQGFSRAGQRQADDPRNELVFEFMRVVIEIRPRAFCMENVPGMLDMVTKEGVPVIDAIALMAEEGGMGTFEALRRSLADTAGVGAALRTKNAGAAKQKRGSSAPKHRLDVDEPEPVEDDQLSLLMAGGEHG